MQSFPLSIYLGPVTLDPNHSSYIANWYDADSGMQKHPIDIKWVPWLEKHFRGGVLSGIGLAFVPAEMLLDNPYWNRRVRLLYQDFPRSLNSQSVEAKAP